MQANGTGQDRDSEGSCRNGAQNVETSSAGAAHSNGVVSVSSNGNSVSNNSSTAEVKKKKGLSQCEEDVIRLIGQHLHDLGLK